MPPTRIAFLIAQHPAINHAVILREIRFLREYLDIHTASVRSPDRPADQLAPEERDEAERTFYVKAAGITGAASALFATFVRSPLRFTAGAFYTAKLAGLRLKQLFLNLAYFAQAAVVGRWMGRNGLTHLHTHYSSTVALLVHKTFGFDISISFHGPDEFNDPAGFWIREKLAACSFARAISQFARSQLMKSCDVADWGKIEVAYMGVDPGSFAPPESRPNAKPVEIICVGRLAPVKAQHILIAALHQVVESGRDVLLHVVGGGPDRASLEQDAASRGIQQYVRFHGFTAQDKLDGLYRQSAIYAMPSFAEGVPGVLMEAMALEIPCVSTWIAGIPELICNGVDGLLVAPSDTDGFAEAIRMLVDDPELRLRIGQAGRRKVLDRFNLHKNAALLADVFERRLKSAASNRR